MYFPTAVLCVLHAASAITLPKEIVNTTANESQAASVKEVSQPPMTVQNAAPQDYLLPGYYTFNKGEPFFVEKDPLTGAIDFSKKTTPTDKVESNTSSGPVDEKGTGSTESDGDYFYDDQEVEGDGIDRKDGSLQGSNIYRPNEIFQNPYKISPDLHQFLNLPVHYSSSDKFPLISSSYANTKIQGTGSSSNTYSNHKYVTSSTQSPSYYTMPTTRYTTPKPQYQFTTTTTSTVPPTTKPTSTTTEAEEEYENTDYEYEGEDSGSFLDNQAVPSEYHTYKPETTKYTITTYRPTTSRFTTTSKPTTTSVLPPTTTEKSKQQVSIVTSLPVDVYYSTSQEPTVETKTYPSSQSTSIASSTVNSSTNIADYSEGDTTQSSTETTKLIQNQSEYLPTEGFFSGYGEEPFRPIFGPLDTPAKHESNNQIQYNKHEFLKPKPTELNEFQRLPPQQNIPYIQRPPSQTLPPQMEPPRPDAPQAYFPDQPVKLVPGQHTSISFGDPTKVNTISRPIQEYERPPPVSTKYQPQETKPPQSRPNIQPVYEGRPIERPISTVRPRPDAEIPVKSNFKTPTKIESHFIKVSPDQENPSYSLQTSFSIGVPSGQGDREHPETHPAQGVGQVFFPDNSPAENAPIEANLNIPSQVLRPPNNRVPIQSYQPNRPGYRQPIHAQTRPPLPFRLPNDDLQPPSGETDNYPRPHWENHNKPFHGPTQNAIPKKEIILPQYYPGLNRGKPEHVQRPDLPNILPQFRPNAKVGHSEYHQAFSPPGDRVKEPVDTLQPPPLPQPQHLRINRNDDESDVDREFLSLESKGDPLVHRRSGPQPGRVTTLQMMQQNTQRKPSMHTELPSDTRQSSDKDKPVFVVYPSVHGITHRPTPDEAVVIGTRAQRPLPPANLEKDDLDTFPLDDNKQFPIPGRDRVDTPILKTKVTKPVVKNEFPYAIIKPNTNDMAEERILVPNSVVKEYTAFSPTQSSSTEETKDHDSEINLIPYLQDYMPFATKKPQVLVKPPSSVKTDSESPQKPIQPNHVISTTLNASLAKITTEKVAQKKVDSEEKDGSEMTVSATMYTQHRPTNHKSPVVYTPSEPQPQGFQAPFMASLSAPQSHGWSVITDKTLQPATEESVPASENTDGDDTKFDIEHFKPQLFGGFKPILPSAEEESGLVTGTSDKDKDVLLSKADREE